MRTAYRVISHIIAAVVIIQAALIAWTLFGLLPGFESGVLPAEPPLSAMLHGNIGMIVTPLLALALVVIAILGHAGLKWSLWLLVAVVVQIALAFIAFDVAWVGALHGVNAFTIIAVAEVGARAVAHAPEHVPHVKQVMRPAV